MSDRAWNEIEGQLERRVWSCGDSIAIISNDKISLDCWKPSFEYFNDIHIINSLVPKVAKYLTPEILQFSNAVIIDIEATSQLLESVLVPWFKSSVAS